jgi:predicted DNA-binding transcriptional regulator AlpA
MGGSFMPDIYLTTQDLQNKYKVGRGTIDRWRKEGMPCMKIGRTIRFDGVQVEQWIKKQNVADRIR